MPDPFRGSDLEKSRKGSGIYPLQRAVSRSHSDLAASGRDQTEYPLQTGEFAPGNHRQLHRHRHRAIHPKLQPETKRQKAKTCLTINSSKRGRQAREDVSAYRRVALLKHVPARLVGLRSRATGVARPWNMNKRK